MGSLIRFLIPLQLLRPIARPVIRFVVGVIAIPLFRLFLKRVVRLQELDAELEKDLEEWFRGSLLLLVASANMETFLFKDLFELVPFDLSGEQAWIAVGFRLLLAIGVIEAMPDQELFSIIHPGPPTLNWSWRHPWKTLRIPIGPYCRGLICQHLNRSSPVLAIMAAIYGGDPTNPAEVTACTVGWVCYGMAIVQYLIIGLVTSRDKALNVLGEFDRQVAIRRRELIEEFSIDESVAANESSADVKPEPSGKLPNASVAKQPKAGYVSD